MLKFLPVVATVLLIACSSPAKKSEYQGAGKFVEDEVAQRVTAFRYQSGPALLQSQRRLAYIGEPAIPHLLDGMRDASPMTRASCAYVLGMIRDIRTVDELLGVATSDKVSTVRYQAAEALVNIGSKDGYPVLIEGLRDPEIRNRYKCFEVLHDLTKLDFGYAHDAGEDEREVAVVRWEQWWRARTS
jgi:hypothetical protein